MKTNDEFKVDNNFCYRLGFHYYQYDSEQSVEGMTIDSCVCGNFIVTLEDCGTGA